MINMNYMNRALLLPLLFFLTSFRLSAADKPNIIFIMSDDMGFSDIGCYGSEIRTPVLDELAANGIRFTQFYNTARCCPTRASLLTGLYPHQAGVGHMMGDYGHIGYQGNLNRECVTVAEALKSAGYRSYISGKWHVTRHTPPEGPKHNWPRQRGFDRFYGTIHGAGSFYDPNSLTLDNQQISPYADPNYQPEEYYYTDAISDYAVKFLDQHQAEHAAKPFFMYVSYTAAHWPMHALEKDVARYKGEYDEGYEAIRAARFKRMKKAGLIASDAELSPAPEKWADNKHQAWDIRNMEVYAAMVDNMDAGIGRLVTRLKHHRQFENTLILFFQDNGGCAEGLGRNPRGKYTRRPDKPPFPPMSADALQRDMIPKQTRDGYPLVMGKDIMAGPADTYIAYGRGWANVSNTPFREYKHWVHEGGISTPLIAHWPKGIHRKGVLEHQPGHLVDLMATAVDMAGATYPTTYHEGNQKIQPMEGVSLVPAFHGKKLYRKNPIYWEHEGNRAIRDGDWKLVAKGAKGAWELYNIADDRSEMHDLADKHPEKTKALADAWQTYAERARVLPLNPQRQKKKPPQNQKKKDKPKAKPATTS